MFCSSIYRNHSASHGRRYVLMSVAPVTAVIAIWRHSRPRRRRYQTRCRRSRWRHENVAFIFVVIFVGEQSARDQRPLLWQQRRARCDVSIFPRSAIRTDRSPWRGRQVQRASNADTDTDRVVVVAPRCQQHTSDDLDGVWRETDCGAFSRRRRQRWLGATNALSAAAATATTICYHGRRRVRWGCIRFRARGKPAVRRRRSAPSRVHQSIRKCRRWRDERRSDKSSSSL